MNTISCKTRTGEHEGYDFRAPLAEYVRSQALPIDKLGHQPRLYALTQLVGQGMSYDDDVVYAAAWLHDLGVFIGHRPEDPELLSGWDNVSYAMKQAPAALLRSGFPTTKVAQVVEAIRTHQTPVFGQDDEKLVYDTVHELLETKKLSSETYERAFSTLGRDKLIELVAAVGFYMTCSVTVNAFDIGPRHEGKRLI